MDTESTEDPKSPEGPAIPTISASPAGAPPLTLRRARPDDAAAVAAWMADPAVYGQLLQMPHPSTEFWRERLAANKAGGGELSLVAVQGGQPVGMAGLHEPRAVWRRRHAMALGISVAVHAHGQGVGSALMRELLDYADRWANLMRVELTVFADNARAIALYRRFGFEEEGRMRAYAWRDGAYADCLSMARLRPS
jgi:putative acetyltransferase